MWMDESKLDFLKVLLQLLEIIMTIEHQKKEEISALIECVVTGLQVIFLLTSLSEKYHFIVKPFERYVAWLLFCCF